MGQPDQVYEVSAAVYELPETVQGLTTVVGKPADRAGGGTRPALQASESRIPSDQRRKLAGRVKMRSTDTCVW